MRNSYAASVSFSATTVPGNRVIPFFPPDRAFIEARIWKMKKSGIRGKGSNREAFQHCETSRDGS